MINTYNPNSQEKIFYYLTRLYNTVNSKNINLEALDNIINELLKYKNLRTDSYLKALLYPEIEKGCKIPSTLPIPTCSFQLHNSINLKTNDKGNLFFLFNPFFVYSNTLHDQLVYSDEVSQPATDYYLNYASSLYYCNDDLLTGRAPPEIMQYKLLNIGQGIPDLYNQYRLVSASLIVKYIGRMDIASGVIGGSIIFDENIKPGNNLTSKNRTTGEIIRDESFGTRTAIEKYSNFDLAIDSYYHQETNCVNGIRMVYFPVDNSYEEYSKTMTKLSDLVFTKDEKLQGGVYLNNGPTFYAHNKNKFQQMVYVFGAPPTSECFKLDIYLNFETLPNATYLNYMPISPNNSTLSNEDKKNTISLTQQNAITTANASSVMNYPKETKLFSNLNTETGKYISADLLNMNQ